MAESRKLEDVRKREAERARKQKEKVLSRQRRVILTLERPLMPAFVRSLYQCMRVLPLLTVLFELIFWFRNRSWENFLFFVRNALLSASVTWLLLAAVLVFCCAVQMVRLKHGYEEWEYFFQEDLREEEKEHKEALCVVDGEDELTLYARKPAQAREKLYAQYVKTAVIGMLASALFLLLSAGMYP